MKSIEEELAEWKKSVAAWDKAMVEWHKTLAEAAAIETKQRAAVELLS